MKWMPTTQPRRVGRKRSARRRRCGVDGAHPVYIFSSLTVPRPRPHGTICSVKLPPPAHRELDTLTAQVMIDPPCSPPAARSTAALLGARYETLATRRYPATGAREPRAAGSVYRRRFVTSRHFAATTATCETPPPWTDTELPADSHLLLLWKRPSRSQPSSGTRRVPS